jgi:SecD/SecF fusion protein
MGLAICVVCAAFVFFTLIRGAINIDDRERVYMEMVIEGDDIQGTINVLQKRLESYGVKGLRTESLEQNVLTISLPPQDSMQCIRKLMCTKGRLEFLTTYTGGELYSSFIKAEKVTSEKSGEDSSSPLFDILNYEYSTYARIGLVNVKDTAKVAEYLRMPEVKEIIGKDFIPAWSKYPEFGTEDTFALIGIRRPRENEKVLDSDEVEKAVIEYYDGAAEIRIKMTKKGSRIFSRLTRENVGRQIAAMIDGRVYMYPTVNEMIDGGECSITGNEMTQYEVETTAAILNGGMLPSPVMITREWRDTPNE